MASFAATRVQVEAARVTDFSRLDEPSNHVYLDHAGAGQYPSRLLQRHLEDLSTHLYANPHSGGSGSGGRVSELVQATRGRVLQHFNTTLEHYTVIFTSGCTASLKLLAESFDFSVKGAGDAVGGNKKSSSGGFFFLNDNHTSVMGIREVAHTHGLSTVCFSEAELLECFKQNSLDSIAQGIGNFLFAFPAQSNFCGRRYPLKWIEEIQVLQNNPGRNFVLLDAAAYVTTSVLDLSKYAPDFVSLSFYKMFGFPTGLGALLVKNKSADVLLKTYFGGGTVKVSIPGERFHILKDELSEKFEDGTVNYLDILALRHAFETFHEITQGLRNVSDYTFVLTKVLYQYLKHCHHGNETPVAVVYSDTEFEDLSCQGPIITFNILCSSGDHMGFAEVSKLAQLYNIHLRTGCFCNPGGCQRHLPLSNEHVKANFQEGHVCGDDMDLVNGLPTGAVRISVGYSNTVKDVIAFIVFIEECFVEGRRGMDVVSIEEYVENKLKYLTSEMVDSIQHVPIKEKILERIPFKQAPKTPNSPSVAVFKETSQETSSTAYVSQICIYPVKSCAAFVTSSWEIGPRGLLYDREWMVVDSAGINLTQKKCPLLVHIQPNIDLDSGVLTLSAPGMNVISVPLTPIPDICISSQMTCITPVCRDTIQGHVCDEEASDWLEQALQLPGVRLVRQDQHQMRKTKRKVLTGEEGSNISLANESQYLLISEKSVEMFHRSMEEHVQVNQVDPTEVPDVQNLISRFRANIIITGNIRPYEEETWSQVKFGSAHVFDVQGGCKRCQVICTDQATGEKQRLVFRALSAVTERKVTFGILLNSEMYKVGRTISVGDPVRPKEHS